jgi:hypothetical protein
MIRFYVVKYRTPRLQSRCVLKQAGSMIFNDIEPNHFWVWVFSFKSDIFQRYDTQHNYTQNNDWMQYIYYQIINITHAEKFNIIREKT